MNPILSSDNLLWFKKSLLKMAFSEKIKTVNNKIVQNNIQYILGRQKDKIFALLWENIG